MAAGGEASLEELRARLETFTQQLENIHELLQTDPTNTEFLGIAKDLVEVIRLTKEMIDLKIAPVEAAPQEQTQERTQERTQESASKSEAATPELALTPGSACEALSQGVWYPAHIEAVTASDTYSVLFLGFGTTDELSASSLRVIAAPASHLDADVLPAKDAITQGFKCEAKYYMDGQFYTCTVTKVTALGFQVLFDSYGNSEEVPYEYLRAVAAPTEPQLAATSAKPNGTAAASAAAAQLAPAAIAKPIKIPENLQIMPADSEAEKERKRKRIRAIKSLNRHKNIDNERNVKQHDWKAFQQKARKKKVRGASGVLSKRGSSIFASPDTVHGRVGVVGSGHGMTSYQDARYKKPKRTPEA